LRDPADYIDSGVDGGSDNSLMTELKKRTATPPVTKMRIVTPFRCFKVAASIAFAEILTALNHCGSGFDFLYQVAPGHQSDAAAILNAIAN
jgi:hypothetical protein